MANRFWEQDEPGAGRGADKDTTSEVGELKALLGTVVEQLAAADRRQTAALSQMQDRLSAMSNEAQNLKSRAPEHFSSAFDRIEAGMAELSAKIAETEEAVPALQPLKEPAVVSTPRTPDVPTKTATPPTPVVDHPVALRSAADYAPAHTNRHHANVDTFDVIESSMPGDGNDLWDQDSADALASVYGTEGQQPIKSAAIEPAIAPLSANNFNMPTGPAMAAMSAPTASAPDTNWLETRFAELSLQLEQSLSSMQSGRGQTELGQRIDVAERNISGLLETVATRTDVEGVRLIEAHVGELVDHLDHAQRQLSRLDTIETQLADLSSKMDEVRSAVLDGSTPQSNSPENIDLLVDKAASAAAQRFAANMPKMGSGEGETRALIERFMVESRQGEENTVALLDTLQQAMIRLLDRVDAMELTQHQAIESLSQSQGASSQNENEEQATFGRRIERERDVQNTNMLDAAAGSRASSKMRAPSAATASLQAEDDQPLDSVVLHAPNSDEGAQPAPRTPEKMRQDFIADARRAKMRLSTNGGDASDIADEAPEEFAVAPGRVTRGNTNPAAISVAAAPEVAKSRFGSPMPRLIVLGLGALLAAIAGAWYVLNLGNPFDPASNAIVKDMGPPTALPEKKPEKDKGALKNKKEARTDAAPQAIEGEPAESENEPGAENEEANPKINLHKDIRGEIIPGDITVGSADVIIKGVTVDTASAASLSDIQKAKRQQAMAMASSKIGQAASGTPSPTPAALTPNDALADVGQSGKALTSVTKTAMGQTSPLDLPPAMVGPLSLRLAAANGDPSAQFQVGSRLAEGKGNEQNFAEAAKWYQRAASTGFAQAQYRLGTLYERGLGLKADAAKASDWYTKSAELGNVKAMHNLAVMSANQRGSSPDYETAAKWFTQAADRGLSDSQFNLAVLHENGLGVQQDLKTAYKWLEIASRGGDAEAIRRRDILKGKLTSDDLAAAEALAKTWKVKQVDPMINDARTAGEAWKKNPANGVSG